MGMNWLYGRPVDGSGTSGLSTRSVVVDRTTVEEIMAMQDAFGREQDPNGAPPFATMHVMSEPGGQQLELAELTSVHEWKLNRLVIFGPAHLAFHPGYQPIITPASLTAEGESFARAVAHKLLSEGQPRPRILALIRFLPVPFMAVLIASWVWLLVSFHVPLPAALVGSIVVFFTLIAGAFFTVWFRRWSADHAPQNRVRAVSREEMARERANRHRDAKVALWSIGGSALVLIPLTVILERLINPSS